MFSSLPCRQRRLIDSKLHGHLLLGQPMNPPILTNFVPQILRFFFERITAQELDNLCIPTTAVKPVRADGTARAAWWESRSSPGFYYSPVGGPSEGRPTVDKDDRAGRPWRRGRPVGHE